MVEYPTVEALMQFVRDRVQVLENAGTFTPAQVSKAVVKGGFSINRTRDDKSKFQQKSKQAVTLVTNKLPVEETTKCQNCSQSHKLQSCPGFRNLSIDERYQIASRHRLCLVCFGSNHWAGKCPSKCSICHGRHNDLLHRDGTHSKKASTSNTPTSLVSAQGSRSVLLGTAIVYIQDAGGCLQQVRALIDSASQISIMTTTCVDRLNLHREHWTAPVSGLAGQKVSAVKGIVQLNIQPVGKAISLIPVKAWILPSITGLMPSSQVSSKVRNRCSKLPLADPCFDIPAPIELLLGADIFPQIWKNKSQDLGHGLPTAFSSVFGWIIMGPIQNEIVTEVDKLEVSLLTTSVEAMVERFWQVEEPEEAPSSFTKEGKCEDIFSKEWSRDDFGRFIVPLPFQVSPSVEMFQGSRSMAVTRFERLEQKLVQDKQLYEAYKEFMLEYESMGHMSVASCPGTYFIPHHAVRKMVGDSFKLRVVFDASARPPSGKSLNEVLLVGPKLQQDIVNILLGFRVHRIAFTADICKMYRQILLAPKYRCYQHIFWRSSPHDKLQEYELNTVTYGVGSAPYLALRVLQEIASRFSSQYPDVQQALRYQTYMDDVCTGADTVEEAECFQYNLISILSQFGLELKKWASNSPKLLNNVPAGDRAIESLSFNDCNSSEVQVLGLKWNPKEDTFNYNVSLIKAVSSKRGMLSVIARIFDPVGFLSPVIFYAKHLMQCVWQSGVSWDERLPNDIESDWLSFVAELKCVSSIRVPRFIGISKGCLYELCGFCDASAHGYAAVVYLRVTNPISRMVSISLLGAKTKLAPIKVISIPRLELCAAGLLARWLKRTIEVLNPIIPIHSVYAWSDSSIVLSWLNKPHTSYKVFVSNRVHQIQQQMPDCRWFHVSSDMNPADCASRGLRPGELAQHSLYWQGPSFLHPFGEGWNTERPLVPDDQLPEVKVVTTLVVKPIGENSEWFSRFSSFNRMLRVVAWMCRFVALCRKARFENNFLSFRELDKALVIIVQCSQYNCLKPLVQELRTNQPVSSRPLARLCPFFDAQTVIRVGGRLRHSNLSERRKHPILLSKESHLSILVAKHWHVFAGHAGPRLMSALICRQFWIVADRKVIRKVISDCTICVKLAGVHTQPIISDLPSVRVQQCRTFSCVGIDYAGPLLMKELNLRKSRQYKVYIAVFVCMSVKAVHLEVVLDLSTDAFLAALDRFVARRGLPSAIYSDCGTNFVGASKQLFNLVNDPSNRNRLTSAHTCEWHFNPPSAPHFGGIWEAAVRSTKLLLVRIVGTHSLTLEEFTTVLCRIESALNSRPLTPLSTDPNDLECLTPGHFLIGQPLMAVPELEIPVSSTNLKNRWKLLHQTFQAFWRRWSHEYLNTLQVRGKWVRNKDNVKVGDMVVIKNNLSPPLMWQLGRIQEVLPGPDGVVRVVKLLTKQGLVTRPVVKLVQLPTE